MAIMQALIPGVKPRRFGSPVPRGKIRHYGEKYGGVPTDFIREMNNAWITFVSNDIDYERASRAWRVAYTGWVRVHKEDPLRFAIDMIGCLEALAEKRNAGEGWLQLMSYETVAKMLDRYRRGDLHDSVASALKEVLWQANQQ